MVFLHFDRGVVTMPPSSYAMIQTTSTTEDNITYTAYGIEARTPSQVVRIQDISSKKEFVLKMVIAFNASDMPVEHMKSVILALIQ